MSEEVVEKKWTKEELLRLLDEVEREPRRRSTERVSKVDDKGYPEWDEKKIAFAKKVIKGLDDSIRGVCILNKYASVDHRANIVFRIHLDELFVTKPAFGRYDVDEEVWQYLMKRVRRMMEKLEKSEKPEGQEGVFEL